MEKLAKRIRSSNKQYFDAGVDAGTQKACDLLLVAAYCVASKTKDDVLVGFWNASAQDKAAFAFNIQAGVVMDVIRHHAGKIKEILEGDGDEKL